MAAYAAAAALTTYGLREKGRLESAQKAQHEAAQEAYKRQAEAQAAQLESQRQSDERRRQDALRRTLAAQRAEFGGRGISAAGGSAKAVLDGLVKRVQQDNLDADAIANIRINQINSQLANRQYRSLLEPSGSRFSYLDKFLSSAEANRSLLG